MDLDNPNNGVGMSIHGPVITGEEMDQRRITDLEDEVEQANNKRPDMEQTMNQQATQITHMEQMMARMERLMANQNTNVLITNQRAPDPARQRSFVKMPKLASFDGSRGKTRSFLQSLTLYFKGTPGISEDQNVSFTLSLMDIEAEASCRNRMNQLQYKFSQNPTNPITSFTPS